MTAQEIRKQYLDFFAERGHRVIPRAKLISDNDPTTLFTGSGMQPLLPYLMGADHPAGVRLVDSQTCLRAQDIDEIGDNRHTTFFEMLGNWSLGDYFKEKEIPWFWEFLTGKIGLDPARIYVTCFIGDEANGIPRDQLSADIWAGLFSEAKLDSAMIDLDTEENGARIGIDGSRIAFYGNKNWWARNGMVPSTMIPGEPGGPSTEMFYLFPTVEHDISYGEKCHFNCDCGRYIELGNSVFMEYFMNDQSKIVRLPKLNVDYGGGLERIAAAALDSPDIYRISLMWPIIEKLQALSSKKYESYTESMRVIADHLRAATFLAVDGCVPSNKEQGYVMRRLLRRAIRYSFDLGIEQNFLQEVVPVIADLYHDDFPEVANQREEVIAVLVKEEKIFRQTLRKGMKEFSKMTEEKAEIDGVDMFKLYDTYGFPVELTIEEALHWSKPLTATWRREFDKAMNEQRTRSQTAAKGTFKGGLGGQSLQHKKYHTATHLMYQALRDVLGNHVVQHGSNITEERLRFDFSHPEKVTPDQIKQVEDIVNDQIARDLHVSFAEYPTAEATGRLGALGQFGDRYGETVKVYKMIADDVDKPFSFEICGGPHVEHTSQLSEDGKRFKIIKEESSSAGIRRIKAILA